MTAIRRPEVLAPCGDAAALEAALAAGADAVYFGLSNGFNARGRATNFSLEVLPATMRAIHRAGVRAYVTVNTLVFESELETVEALLRAIAAAGVDAIIVQDPAVALIARALCPELAVHASTQMTISSGEGARFAAGLGVRRVVVPRELSVAEIDIMAKATPMPLEVFIHGALCVSWSGQCLTSEAWGGRSANRGQCAQSCRMPYDLVVDGRRRDLGDVRYLLSPKDLAGVAAVEDLARIGVASLKIEGRQKAPAYVASAVRAYRQRVDGVLGAKQTHTIANRQGARSTDLGGAVTDMALTYSRGFSSGFLEGADHQSLVEGRFPKHRGIYLGVVDAIRGKDVFVTRDESGRPWTGHLAGPEGTRAAQPEGKLASPLTTVLPDPARAPRPGMGVVFERGNPENQDEPGGPLFRVESLADGWVFGFGQPGPDLRAVRTGDKVWLSGDPSIEARVRSEMLSIDGRHPVALRVAGELGAPMRVEARSGVHTVVVSSVQPLSAATGRGLDDALIADKLGALGGTPFSLANCETNGLGAGLHLPVSALKELRREFAAALEVAVLDGPPRSLAPGPVVEGLREALASSRMQGAVATSRAQLDPTQGPAPKVLPLCRTEEQLAAVIELGFDEVELDWMEFVGLGRAVERARASGLTVTVATVRVQKPGEEGYDARIDRLAPDAVLVRHWGAVMHFLERADAASSRPRPLLHGDFSLNVTNSLTAAHLLALGLDTLTCSHDLDETQLAALLASVDAARITVPIHHHIATFHTEHCVYAHCLSNGRDFRSCGRPCEEHEVALRDHVGQVHPVVVDVACRNTVFNAKAQSAASMVPSLLAQGVRRFRVELVRESGAIAGQVLSAYRELVAGRAAAAEVLREVGAHEQFGVTRGTMRVLNVL